MRKHSGSADDSGDDLESADDFEDDLESADDFEDDLESADDFEDDLESADDFEDDLESADDSGDDLESADDSGDDLESADDSGDDLESADDSGDDLESADDSGDDLESADDSGDDLESTDDSGDDLSYKFLGKVRLEDLQVSEHIAELRQKLEEFTRGQSVAELQDEQELEDQEGIGDQDSYEQQKEIIAGKGPVFKEPLLRKVLRFLEEFYEYFISEDVMEHDTRFMKFRRRKRKKLLLGAIIAFLKRLLSNKRALNLRELLEAQIRELEKALENEQDPALRRLLQERLSLLTQLRMQLLLELDRGFGTDILLRFLLAYALTSVSLDLHRGKFSIDAREHGMTLVQRFEVLGDVGRVRLGEVAAAHLQQEVCHADTYIKAVYIPAEYVCPVDPYVQSHLEGLPVKEEVLVVSNAGPQGLHGQHGEPVAGVVERVLGFLHYCVRIVATRIMEATTYVFTIESAVSAAGHQPRGVSESSYGARHSARNIDHGMRDRYGAFGVDFDRGRGNPERCQAYRVTFASYNFAMGAGDPVRERRGTVLDSLTVEGVSSVVQQQSR